MRNQIAFIALVVAASSAMSKTSEDPSSKYRELFLRRTRSRSKQNYRDPRLTALPIEGVERIPGFELKEVIDFPPPPADPVSYEIWIVVNGEKVFAPSKVCEAWQASGRKVGSEKEAREAGRALVYVRSLIPYFEVVVANVPKANTDFADGIWQFDLMV